MNEEVKCGFDGCPRDAVAFKGKIIGDGPPLCRAHYKQKWEGKELKPLAWIVIPQPTPDTKVCTLCRRTLDLHKDFYHRTNGTVTSRCRDCIVAIHSERQRRKNHNLPFLTSAQIIAELGLGPSKKKAAGKLPATKRPERLERSNA